MQTLARVDRDLRRAPQHVVERFLRLFPELAQDPFTPRPGVDIKGLRDAADTYRLRVGRWRFLYHVDPQERVVTVLRAAPRESAYR